MLSQDQRTDPSRSIVLVMIGLGILLSSLLWSLKLPDFRHELSAFVLAATLIAACTSNALPEPWRTLMLSARVVLFMLGAAEAYLTFSKPLQSVRDVDQTFSGTLSQTHRTLGYAPPTSTQVRVTRTARDAAKTVIYDVTYTLDAYARRSVPDAPQGDACVLFFGGSFTGGEGVEDHETLPHQFAVASGFTLTAVNFGFAGYGPNHMLRAMQDNALKNACHGPTIAVVYTTLPVHYQRSAGLVDWGPKSPRYAIDAVSSELRYTGPLYEDMKAFEDFRKPRQCALVRAVWNLIAGPKSVTLYTAIVGAAVSRVESDLGSPFYILYWDLMDGRDPQLHALEQAGLSIIRVSELLTREQMTTLRIPGDGHPNVEAYRLLGHALYERLAPLLNQPSVAEAAP